MRELQTDILIVGAGLGGIAAALAAARLGRRVILTEETDWIGGQLTSQGVPPDEHPWIEATGCTPSYRRLREGIRAYYRRNYPLLPTAAADPHLNPGQGMVSGLCHEPRVALAVLEEMLAPYRAGRQVEVLLRHLAVSAETDVDRVRSVTLEDVQSGEWTTIQAAYVLDASELGELLELAKVEHVIGAESQDDTGEPHALAGPAAPLDQQAISWCFAMDYLPGEDHTIAKPAEYEFWRNYQAGFWPARHLGWTDVNPETHAPRYRPIFFGPTDQRQGSDFWHYRRIFYRGHYAEGLYASDITLVNWPQIDYWLGPLVGVHAEERERNLRRARQLSLSMLYWMQTTAPTREGGYGYRGLRLRGDVLGTSDGLAKHVYVRESRRIQAEFTVLEQHVGVEARQALVDAGGEAGAEEFPDSVGIGSYRIDLHPSTGGRSYIDISSWPFQIPLGALIPVRVENLLPACKNVGTTHITNGCYRLHPVEWNIGEAAGALAAYCMQEKLVPRQVLRNQTYLADYQRLLAGVLRIELAWPRFGPR
jgi:hypothetical protein